MKRSGGRAESVSAPRTAEAPGMAVTAIPASTAAWTSLYPGSESKRTSRIADQGQRLAVAHAGHESGPHFRRIVIMIGRKTVANAIAVEKFCRYARVFAQDQVRRAQGFERAQGNVTEIADGRRGDIEACGKRRRLENGGAYAIAVGRLGAWRHRGKKGLNGL